MPSISEFADFIEALHARRQDIAQRAPTTQAAGAVAESWVLDHALVDLADAEAELRAQNDALFDARISVEESAALFRDLFDLAPVAYLVTDVRARIRQVNSTAAALLARPVNYLVGKPLACYVALAERGAFREALTRSGSASGVEEWPLRVVPAGGPPIECRVRVRVLRNGEGPTHDRLAWVITETTTDAFDGI